MELVKGKIVGLIGRGGVVFLLGSDLVREVSVCCWRGVELCCESCNSGGLEGRGKGFQVGAPKQQCRKIFALFSFVVQREEIFLNLPRRTGGRRGLEDSSKKVEEHWGGAS